MAFSCRLSKGLTGSQIHKREGRSLKKVGLVDLGQDTRQLWAIRALGGKPYRLTDCQGSTWWKHDSSSHSQQRVGEGVQQKVGQKVCPPSLWDQMMVNPHQMLRIKIKMASQTSHRPLVNLPIPLRSFGVFFYSEVCGYKKGSLLSNRQVCICWESVEKVGMVIHPFPLR